MLIEKLKAQPIFQIVWTVFLIFSLFIVYPLSAESGNLQLSPFLQPHLFVGLQEWLMPFFFITSFLLLFVSLFSLSSLLRNFNFTGDSRFDMLFLLVPFLLLFPAILFRLDLAIFIFLTQNALRLQFDIHTQISIRKEIALMGFYMSLASIFFPLALVVALIFYLGILFQRGFYLKELLIFLILLALPFYFIISIIYLFDLPFLYSLHHSISVSDISEVSFRQVCYWTFILIFLYLIAQSFLVSSKSILRAKAQFRNFYMLIILGALVAFFIYPIEGVAITFLPLFAVFSVGSLRVKRKWLLELLLLLLSFVAILQILLFY